MADYGSTFNDPTLNYYGGGTAPPYLPLDTGLRPTPPTAPTQQSVFAPPPGNGSGPTGVPDPNNPGYDTAGYPLDDPNSAPHPTGGHRPTRVPPTTTTTDTGGGAGGNSGTNIYDPNLYTPFSPSAPVFRQPPPFQAPTLEEAENYPGYKFGVQQGEQALQQSAAAKGLLRSGGTLKGILDYGRNAATQNYANVYGQNLGIYQTNLASQFQQPFDNAFTTYIAEQNRFRQNQTDPFNKYLELIKAANPNV